MGLGDAALSGLKNTFGYSSKATITIVDSASDAPIGNGELAIEMTEMSGVSSGTRPSNSFGGPLGGQMPNMALDIAASAIEAAQKLADKFTGDNKLRFEVQFNPATLNISAQRGGVITSVDFTGNNAAQGLQVQPTYMTMNVDLIFNKVDPSEAFLDQKLIFTQALQGNVKSTLNTLSKFTGSVGYSVQSEIEGLIAACKILGTVYVKFDWGKLSYVGLLDALDCEYKMFSPKGEPIYGVVHLSMILADPKVTDGNLGKWNEAYLELIKDGPVSMNTLSNKVGSYLNFSL